MQGHLTFLYRLWITRDMSPADVCAATATEFVSMCDRCAVDDEMRYLVLIGHRDRI